MRITEVMDNNLKKANWQDLQRTSYLAGSNAPYIEAIYENYLNNPSAVSAAWREYFEDLPAFGGKEKTGKDAIHSQIRESFRQLARQEPAAVPALLPQAEAAFHEAKQVRILQLINAYRFRGHQHANIDPLGLREYPDIPELDLGLHGLSEADLETQFDTGSLVGPQKAPLRQIMEIVKQTYCGSIGSEYMHITNTEEKRWIQHRLESDCCQPRLDKTGKRRILEQLTAAEGLENYLHTQYVGQKRFSLEGAESLIPLLRELIALGGTQGIKEMVIGMAHRGRLNVLVNIMGKTPKELFREFEGKHVRTGNGSGDVKYHKGFSSNLETPGGIMHVALAFNPSHLEIVGPVVEGSVRARQTRRNDDEGNLVVPIIIHGDAAFSGQGVVMETFSMSQSRGYATKGTIHIVINNQIGFTTSSQKDSRSTLYCTDVAKMVSAPIFHVNGDDPEAVMFVTRAALDYRMLFHKDVVIDLVCYRRHGHSEADEPTATQPMMYKVIKGIPTTRAVYAEKLRKEGAIKESDAEKYVENYQSALKTGESVVLALVNYNDGDSYPHPIDWRRFVGTTDVVPVNTAISLEEIRELITQLETFPDGFTLHRSVQKIYDNRRKMAAGALPLDWGFAETLAYASIIKSGYDVRLSGQDCGRGTFFHRHAVLYNQKDGEQYIPLRGLKDATADFLVINSLLSEEAVLAFEYGYSTTDPETLTIWEAQFGDFANNAQVVIDQFISAGEQKWNRLSGLVMLLPHGFEGQGPEHSSARLERYLQLCAEQNMQVCVPTTASQIFHLLRRQILGVVRKPLIVMTPKSLLRHRFAASSLEDITDGKFETIISEIDELDRDAVRRIAFCSGKVYYDLLERRRKEEITDVAIVRIEQLYPFPTELLREEIYTYPNATEFTWCQEEPRNQGMWYSSQHHVRASLGNRGYLEYSGRLLSAAPAVGYLSLHIQQLNTLLEEALGITEKTKDNN